MSGAEILYAVWKGYYEDMVHSYYETAACRDSLDRGYVRGAAVEWLAGCRSAGEEGTVPLTYSEFLADGDPSPSFQFVVTDAQTGSSSHQTETVQKNYVGQVCYIPGGEDAAGQVTAVPSG